MFHDEGKKKKRPLEEDPGKGRMGAGGSHKPWENCGTRSRLSHDRADADVRAPWEKKGPSLLTLASLKPCLFREASANKIG